MRTLCREEMGVVEGEGFWGGVACGVGAVLAFASVVSPEPLSKMALLTYGGAVVGCASAF